MVRDATGCVLLAVRARQRLHVAAARHSRAGRSEGRRSLCSAAAAGWAGQQLAEHVRTEFSTFTWLLEAMLGHAGFEIRDRWTSSNQMYAAYTSVKR